MPRVALGGLAVVGDRIYFGDRDVEDFHDVYRCLDADSGELVWEVKRVALASLDYGNSPRATPLVWNGRVYFQGALGHFLCLDARDGELIWEKNFRFDYPIDVKLPWGYCASPLICDGKLFVAPGAADASVVALDAMTGRTIWQAPGRPPGYGSFIVGDFGGTQQIVGHDATTLGGWDAETGKRLWSVTPEYEGDFNVPTPVAWKDRLVVSTENNGCRVYSFKSNGVIKDTPIAEYKRLRNDMSTPVVVGDSLFCLKNLLFCLDLSDGLNHQLRLRDKVFGDYAAMAASETHLLIAAKGELILMTTGDNSRIVSRLRIFDESVELFSHFALAGDRLYIRGEKKLLCLRL
jgi:outer membrane protein assembly factor BamB